MIITDGYYQVLYVFTLYLSKSLVWLSLYMLYLKSSRPCSYPRLIHPCATYIWPSHLGLPEYIVCGYLTSRYWHACPNCFEIFLDSVIGSLRLAIFKPSTFWLLSWSLRISMGYILSARLFEVRFQFRAWAEEKGWSAPGRSRFNQINDDMAASLMLGNLWFVWYNYGLVARHQHGVSHRYAMKILSRSNIHESFCYSIAHSQIFSRIFAVDGSNICSTKVAFSPGSTLWYLYQLSSSWSLVKNITWHQFPS